MAESVFEAVKQSVTVREVAQMYGIEANRSGMACCPFHDDKNPSMKLNEEYFYCFGCGTTGDVIDFTARLYNLSPKEAAEKLAQDFGLAYDSQAPPRRRYVRQKTEAQKFKEDRDHTFRVLADYYHLLRKWETDYSPKTPEENPHPRFMEAIQKKDYTGYLLDFFLEDGPEEQKLWIAEHQSEIANLERRVKFMADKPTNRERLQEITAGIEQGIKELFESEKYMRYLSVMSKFEIEDMALYNVGIPLDFDLLAALGVQGLPVAILGEKQANLIAGAAVGGTGLADRKFNHPSGAVLKSLHSQNVMSFQLTG